MEPEINDGIAYLRALKQSGDPQAASAAAPAREASSEDRPVASSPFSGAEKRRSPRYKCEGSAEIREAGCDVHTWATFTDISLHGCYVEAQATYPIGAKLHMKLAANGLKVEAEGTVRVSYPYLGMGIAFSEMSDDDRKRLRELLGTVSRPSVIIGPGIASALPSCGPLDAVPLISDPPAAIQALIAFFETRHMLTREEFLSVLHKSQMTQSTR